MNNTKDHCRQNEPCFYGQQLYKMNGLGYDDAPLNSSVNRVLFIHSPVSDLQTYHDNTTTFAIVYSHSSTLDEVLALLRRKFTQINRIGFAFHNTGDSTGFLDGETFFSDSDLVGLSSDSFTKNTQFMINVIREFGVGNVDFLGCNTLQSEKWREYFQLLRDHTGVVVGASDDNTGNLKYGGDWIMESTMEDIRDVYFTTAIENWASVLAPSFTIVATDAVNSSSSFAISGNFMYASFGTAIVKIDLLTNTVVNQNWVTAAGSVFSMCALGDYLYYVNHVSGSIIGRANLTDGTVVESWMTGLYGSTSCITTDGTYLYFACYPCVGANGIIRVNPSLFTSGSAAPASWLTGLQYTLKFCFSGGFLYAWIEDPLSGPNSNKGKIRKYNMTDLTFTILSNGPFPSTMSMVAYGSSLYIGQTLPGTTLHGIIKVDLTTGVIASPNPFFSATINGGYSDILHMEVYQNKIYCAGGAVSKCVFSVNGLLGAYAPYISVKPTATASITYPATVGSVSFTGGTALTDIGGTVVPGTFTRDVSVSSSTIYNAGITAVPVTFTPTDTVSYLPVTTSFSLTVLKAATVISALPTATVIYPNTLSTVVITGGAATGLSGTFTVDPTLTLSVYPAGTYSNVLAVFTPTNSNYNSVATTIQTLVVSRYTITTLFTDSTFVPPIYYCASTPYMGYGPPTVSVNISPVSQNSSFIFTIINRTNATIGYSISGQNSFWPLTAGQLGLTSLTSTTVSSGLTTISCTNTSSVHQTITCTLTNVSPTTAVTTMIKGPTAYLQVNTASSVPYDNSFNFTINNTSETSIIYSLTSTPTLVFTDLSLSNAAAITNISVAAGVRSTITCWNKTSAAKTVVLSSSGLTSVQAVLVEPPSVIVSTSSTVEQGSSFTFTIRNTTSGPITFSMTSTQFIIAEELYTGASSAYSLLNQQIPVGDTIIYCKNQGTSLQTVTCTVNSGPNNNKSVVLAAPSPTITFNPATTAATGASFTVSIYNPSKVSVTAVLSTGDTSAVTLSDLTIASDTLVVAAGTIGVFSCVNAVTTDKTVTCTATGSGLTTVTGTLALTGSLSAVLSLTNFANNLGSTTGVGYNTSTYTTNAATGITFNGSGSGYVMYGTSTASTTTNCLNIGKNSFKLVFDATHNNTGITSQHCWATTPNQAVGLLYFFTSNTPYMICYSATGTVQFVGRAMTYGTKATFTLMRLGTKLSCTMLYNSTTSNMTASAPNANFTYSAGVVTANSLTNNQDLGVFPLRIGGWAANSAGANYATANTNAGNQVFSGTINNFIYYSVDILFKLNLATSNTSTVDSIAPAITSGTPARDTNGLKFTGTEYIIYGSYPSSVATNCFDLGKNSFKLVFDVKYTALTDGYPWSFTPDYSKGLMMHTLVNGTQDIHIWINSATYKFSTSYAINTLYKFTILRTGKDMSVTVSINGGTDTAVGISATPANHTYNSTTKVLSANTDANIIDLGLFPLRIGGWQYNASYTTTTVANTGSFQGYINNFIYTIPTENVTVTFNPATTAIYGQSFTVTIYNQSTVSVTATISTGGTAAVTLTDLTLTSASITVSAGATGVYNCVNASFIDKTVSCTATGTGLTTVMKTGGVLGIPPVLSLTNFAVNLGSTTGVGYGTAGIGYSVNASTGLTFKTNAGYVMYGSATATTTSNCMKLDKNPFKISFDLTTPTTTNYQWVWSTSTDQATGLIFYIEANRFKFFCHSSLGQCTFEYPSYTANTKYTIVLTRDGLSFFCTITPNGGATTNMIPYPANGTAVAVNGSFANYTYSSGVLTVNNVSNHMNFGTKPLRLGGYSNSAAGANYAVGSNFHDCTSTINNFIYFGTLS